MAKKRVNKKPLWKNAGFYFILIYAIFTIAFLVQLFIVDVVPTKYTIPLIIVLVLLLLGMYFLQLGKKVNKVNKVLGKILIVILCVILGFGNWYLFTTSSAFNKMTNDNTQTDVVSIVVLNSKGYKELNELTGKKIGKIAIGDTSPIEQAYAELGKDLNQSFTTVAYKSYQTYADDLFNGKVDAIMVNESSRGLLEDANSNFTKDTTVIKKYTYTKETKDISKNVKVTQEPFSIYITGIDTYGSISSVSRSDVNMIVTVNPKTHQILMTSIPRDYYIPQTCQGGQTDKLTHTGIFGVDCTLESVEDFFGIELNYYARVNFSSVVDIVNALGGVTIDNPVSFVASDGTYSYPAGMVNMDGEMALRFARERYNLADGDRDRGRNQMRVITAMINKMISPTIITRYTSIMSAVSGSFQTNMSNSEMTSLIKMQIDDMSGWDIKQIAVSGVGNSSAWSPANGFPSWVMEPDLNTVNNAVSLIKKVMNGQQVTDTDVQQQNNLDASVG